MRTVADASVVLTWLANPTTDELLRKRLFSRKPIHAPELIDAEVVSGIRGLLIGGKTTIDRALVMLSDFAKMRIIRHATKPYLRRVIELRNNFTAYDALYIALAENLHAPLLTRDAKFSRAAGHAVDVQVYP